jgi:hypothetical protein
MATSDEDLTGALMGGNHLALEILRRNESESTDLEVEHARNLSAPNPAKTFGFRFGLKEKEE